MTAARCSHCDMNYPYDRKKCPICGEETWGIDDNYDSDWKQYVTLKQQQARFEPGQRRPFLDLPTVRTTAGEEWIASALLEAQGAPQEPGEVLLIRGTYYELIRKDFVDDEKTKGGWLIEPIPTEGVFDDDLVVVPLEWATECHPEP